tara:strand:+ start:537 stop:1112 length:576 start_codon:yes stop_codon:yes gene_type:complete
MKKWKLPWASNSEDFFGVYDNALTKEECEILINQFEKSNQVNWGYTETGYQPEVKKCRQLTCYFSKGDNISNIVASSLVFYLDKYKKKYSSLDHSSLWKYYDGYSFQKYEDETQGYIAWHTEQSKSRPERIMAWMFYLNDAKSGTEFMHFPTINAKRGRLVIWPAAWTHTHRGAPNKSLKYIITGWISFLE